MARFKHYDYGQMKLLPVSFAQQILPGTFEHTLNHLIDHEIDLGVFEHRYRNDETGAPAYDPAILLKVILYAYSAGGDGEPPRAAPRSRAMGASSGTRSVPAAGLYLRRRDADLHLPSG